VQQQALQLFPYLVLALVLLQALLQTSGTLHLLLWVEQVEV
jgi:spore maturation protein SpmB